MPDIEKMADDVFVAVRGYVSGLIGDIAKRVNALDERIKAIPAGPKGDKGDAGESIRGERGEPGESIKGEKGDPGERGPAGEVGPAGERGADGATGPQGAAGERGEPGPIGEPGPAGESIKGEAGAPGADGRNGIDGTPGRDGRDGLPGIAGKDGANGLDGKDGFGLEDFDMVLSDDGRTLSFKFVRGEVNVERQVKLATMIYRGVWRESECEPGDVVTWGGSAWHCQEKTTDKPGASVAWKMMVKEGRPGKDGAAPAPTPARDVVRVK